METLCEMGIESGVDTTKKMTVETRVEIHRSTESEVMVIEPYQEMKKSRDLDQARSQRLSQYTQDATG